MNNKLKEAIARAIDLQILNGIDKQKRVVNLKIDEELFANISYFLSKRGGK